MAVDPSGPPSPLLRVADLKTEYITRAGAVRAVDGVSFEVGIGETLGLVGESGCGKSATALSLMRLIPPSSGRIVSGSVVFDGRDLLALGEGEMRRVRGRDIAIVFQDPMTSLNPTLPIWLQIAEVLEVHLRLSRAAARARTVELLDLVGVPSPLARMNDYPHQFSGGMRQRVMIAMALACNPKLVLADEPTTALDVTIQAQILDLLRRLSRELGTAVILITHDLGVVAGMTTRTNVMYAGQIVEAAATSELFANPRMPYTWGLLRSIPRLDQPRKARLVPIDGMPPDLVGSPAGCRFQSRCPYRRQVCAEQSPELLQLPSAAPGHLARCWGVQAGGWLADARWGVETDPRARVDPASAAAGPAPA